MSAPAVGRLVELLGSRVAKLLVGACAVLLVGVDVYATSLILHQQQVMQDISRYNVTWTTTQAAYELARLEIAVGGYAAGTPAMDRDEVQLRLDIVLSRAQLFDGGELAAFLLSRPDLAPIVGQLNGALDAAQPLVNNLDQPGAPNRLLSLLAPLNAPLTRLSAVAHDQSELQMARDIARLSQLYWIVTSVLLVLIGSSLALVWILIRHNRLIRRAHHEVHSLVDELQRSGDALAYAMADLRSQNAVLQQRDKALDTQNTRFNAALNNMSQALIMVDCDERLIVCNARYSKLFDLTSDQTASGTRVEDLTTHVRASGGYGSAMIDSISAKQRRLALERQAGTFFEEDENGRALSISHQPMADGGWVATYEDITERRRAEARIQHMADHDALTDLLNRRVFHARLQEGLGSLHEQRGQVAVHSLDLDLFKHVNDTLGHPAGDVLLEAVSSRLRRCVRESDVVARLGGDEFAIIQFGVSQEEAAELAARILNAIRAPYDLDGRRAVVSASIGTALSGEGVTSAERLFCNADLALYRSKASGRGTFHFFEPGMDIEQSSRFSIELDLREALDREELQVHYQPLFDLSQERITGYEALMRWHHPQRGAVMPSQFIPIAEETGLINSLGEWILRQACMDAANWLVPTKVAVNLSPMQFGNGSLVGTVREALRASGLAPERLELEITESVLLQNDDRVLATLHELRGLGVKTVLDDFGTGYSSLSYLRSFPFDKIKVDRSFVRDMSSRADCLAIIESISHLARRLGMTTTAEGVETEEQLEQLRPLGFTEVQGFLFGRPRANDSIPSLSRTAGAELESQVMTVC